MKRIEHLEQAKKVLSGGLSLLHRTSEWYSSQLETVESQLRTAQNENNESEMTTNLSLNCNINMVQDLNLRLNHLLQLPLQQQNTDKKQPQFDGKSQQPILSRQESNFEMQRRIERLQEQNRMLTREISRQGNRVTALEQDKRSLIKQLFQQTSSNSMRSNASTLR